MSYWNDESFSQFKMNHRDDSDQKEIELQTPTERNENKQHWDMNPINENTNPNTTEIVDGDGTDNNNENNEIESAKLNDTADDTYLDYHHDDEDNAETIDDANDESDAELGSNVIHGIDSPQTQ